MPTSVIRRMASEKAEEKERLARQNSPTPIKAQGLSDQMFVLPTLCFVFVWREAASYSAPFPQRTRCLSGERQPKLADPT